MKIFAVLILALTLIAATVQAGNLTLGADVSASNPLVASTTYADAVAERISGKINGLEYGDRISLKTFGNGGIEHIKDKSLRISRQMPPQKAATLVVGVIKAFPRQHKGENSTNILAFLENGHFACDKDGSALWLLTDGIEHSIDFNGNDLLKGKKLPDPYEKALEGCEVVMIGVGRLPSGGRLPRNQIHILKTAWTQWLKKAGAASVQILVDP